MNRPTLPTDDSPESDAVWKLLDHATARTAGPRFADDTVRAAKLAGQTGPAWWRWLLAPVPLVGLAAATAAVVAIAALRTNDTPGNNGIALNPPDQDSFAELQEAAEEEALSAAADHLDDFTDAELVCLIGM